MLVEVSERSARTVTRYKEFVYRSGEQSLNVDGLFVGYEGDLDDFNLSMYLKLKSAYEKYHELNRKYGT